MGVVIKGLDGVSRGALWLTLLLTPIIAIAGGLGFQAVGFLLGLCAVLVWMADQSQAGYLKAGWPLALVVFLIWSWISTLWSPHGGELLGGNAFVLLILALTLLFIPIVFLRASDRLKAILTWVVVVTSLIGIALILFDAISGHAFSIWADPPKAGEDPIRRLGDAEMNLGRGQVSYAQLAWPIVFLMVARVKHGRWLAGIFMAALMISAVFNDLWIVVLGLLISGICVALAFWRPKLGMCAAFALAILSLAFAPIIGITASAIDPETLSNIPLSWEHRVRMWAYSCELIQQHPFIGHGFDASRVLDEKTFTAPDGRNIPLISLHPHNVGIQIWLETGVVGVAFICAALTMLIRPVLRHCMTPLRVMAVAGLVSATATCGAATLGVWQHWWWALIVLSVSLIIFLPPKETS